MDEQVGHKRTCGYIPEMERARIARKRAPHGRGAHPQRAASRPSLYNLATRDTARACDLHNLHGSLTAPQPHWNRIHPL